MKFIHAQNGQLVNPAHITRIWTRAYNGDGIVEAELCTGTIVTVARIPTAPGINFDDLTFEQAAKIERAAREKADAYLRSLHLD